MHAHQFRTHATTTAQQTNSACQMATSLCALNAFLQKLLRPRMHATHACESPTRSALIPPHNTYTSPLIPLIPLIPPIPLIPLIPLIPPHLYHLYHLYLHNTYTSPLIPPHFINITCYRYLLCRITPPFPRPTVIVTKNREEAASGYTGRMVWSRGERQRQPTRSMHVRSLRRQSLGIKLCELPNNCYRPISSQQPDTSDGNLVVFSVCGPLK